MKIPGLSVIEKTLDSETTSEESCEVIHWFRIPEGQVQLTECINQGKKAIHMGGEEAWIDHPIPSAVMYQNIMRQLRRQKTRRFMTYVAVVFIPIILVIGLFMRINSQADLLAGGGHDEMYVPSRKRMQVLFQDGSKVHLNSGNHTRYPKRSGLSKRKVYLGGEAWFEAAKSKNQPFIVDLPYMDIKISGTIFNVKAYPEEEAIFVALETGSIELKSKSFKSYRLRPGEKVVYNKASGRCEVSHFHDIKTYSAWRYNMLVFESAPLSDVMKTLTQTYDISSDVKNSTALRYTYTITTDSVNSTTVLKESEKITPVLFGEKGDKIEVRMKKWKNQL